MSSAATTARAERSGVVVLAAGGTGGHLFPAEALASELLGRGRQVVLVTDKRGGAFPLDGVVTYRVPAGGGGKSVTAKVRSAVEVGRGLLASSRLLKRLRPASVVGFGGYPSFPTVLAATRLRLPTLIHEQNAVLGRANRMLATRVRRIATSFEIVSGVTEADRRKIVQTGNPVRADVLALRQTPYAIPQDAGSFRLLVIGGSQGARILSRVVPAALLRLSAPLRARLNVSQQVRHEDAASVDSAYDGNGVAVEARPFFIDLPRRLGEAHLVVCRSGGSTVAELTTAGRPSVLVPYAAALADEQTANAQMLVERGGAWLLPEREFTAEALAQLLEELMRNPAGLSRAAAEAHALGHPAAASSLADLVDRLEAEAA